MSSVLLGKDSTGQPVTLSPQERATHMHVIGASGTGKTKFLESVIRQDIIRRHGLCLIDPTGNLYRSLVCWAETKGLFGQRRILLFDPSAEEWSFGFNPLHFGDAHHEDLSFSVDAMIKACAQVWGGEDTYQTPLLKRCLRLIFHVLAEKRLTLVEAIQLADEWDRQKLRRFLTSDIQDAVIREQWQSFNQMKPRQYREDFSSSVNRLMEFLASERIRRILGQQEAILDFRRVMDDGHILLVNLSSGHTVSEDNASLLGALMVNDLFLKARGRKEGCRPFFVYIDECQRFVNQDIADILDQARQFGLHLILAHQHLSQLEKAGPWIYKAVMTNARTKVVFGGMEPEEARIMAETVDMGDLDLEEPKKSLIRPTVVDYETVWMRSRSETRGESRGTTRGSSTSTSRGEATSSGTAVTDGESRSTSFTHGFLWDERTGRTDGENRGRTANRSRTQSTSSSESESESESFTETFSRTDGESEALAPVLEDLPTAVFNLEEQFYKLTSFIRRLPKQHAVVKIPDRPLIPLQVEYVEPGFARDERIERFQHDTFRQSAFALPKAQARAYLAERQERLRQAAQEHEERHHATTDSGQPAPETPDDFLE